MNVEDEEWVQHALKDFERKRCISKVLSVDCQNAIPKGNNYGSDMYRLKLKTVLHSGDVVNRSFIYKALPTTEIRRKLMKQNNAYAREMRMYTEVLPEMERVRQETNVGVERFTPICYGVRAGCEGYLLEDLNEISYKMVDRLKGLDYHHGEVAIKTLADFHAVSLALIEQGNLVANDFKGHLFVQNPGIIDPMVISNIEELIKQIEEKWKGEWLVYADKLKEYSKTVLTDFVDELRFSENNFNVLVHGDYWMTNMMFRYNGEGLPQTSRLIDFQLTHYNNAGVDLQYFFHTSLNAEALSRKEELLQLYYDSLKYYLTLYGIPEKTPSFDVILENFGRAKIFGLMAGLVFKPLMMQPSEDVPDDLEEWVKEFVSKTVKKPQAPKIDFENLESVLKIILKNASDAGVL